GSTRKKVDSRKQRLTTRQHWRKRKKQRYFPDTHFGVRLPCGWRSFALRGNVTTRRNRSFKGRRKFLKKINVRTPIYLTTFRSSRNCTRLREKMNRRRCYIGVPCHFARNSKGPIAYILRALLRP